MAPERTSFQSQLPLTVSLPDIIDGSLKQLKEQEEQYKGHQLEHKEIQQLYPLVLQDTYHHNRLLSWSRLPTRMMPELM